MMHRFLIVVEKAKNNFAAYSPDLPGCVATGKTREATTQNMYEAIQLHIEGLIEDGITIPSSSSFAEYVAMPGKKTKKTGGKRAG
jgi:predicted RNase H-like HicB family nuclease